MKKFLPAVLLALLTVILSVLNYKSGMILTGGDNLHPEFDLSLNIKRSIFAVWQEYQGLGLLGGMGHASDLFRQICLSLMALIIPLNLLRYVFTMFSLFVGATGTYYLIAYLLKINYKGQTDPDVNIRFKQYIAQSTAFLGGLFYIFNMSTLQTFFVPYEVFTAHFAALPWMILTLIWYAHRPSWKKCIIFSLVLLASTPAAYVPTIFVVFCLAALLLSFFILPIPLKRTEKNIDISGLNPFIKGMFSIWIPILIINSFWLLPFAHFTIQNAHVNIDSKINQMVTETNFLINKEFGNIADVMLLKSFWLNNVEPWFDGQNRFMLEPWREHLANPVIIIIGYFLFFIICVGILSAVRKRSSLMLGFVALFALNMIMLTTNTPPFSWINTVLREYIPLFNQAFRFPFTKFSILTSLVYAIFFALGAKAITEFIILRYRKYLNKHILFLFSAGYVWLITCLVIYMFPSFQGNFIYAKEKLIFPKEYHDVFAFFKKQDPASRIANFPQNTFWEWHYFDWGYGGSGFYWYGIQQPILDRAFDVWSQTSENYYYEATQALYSKNGKQFEEVMDKYGVSWLMIDRHIINPSNPKSLFNNELETMISKNPLFKKTAVFGKVTIYQFNQKNKITKFVGSSDYVPKINSYSWNAYDTAYADYGIYQHTDQDYDVLYPFRSMFTLKDTQKQEFRSEKQEDFIRISQAIPPSSKPLTLSIPNYLDQEHIVPVDIYNNIIDGKFSINMRLKEPKFLVDNRLIWGNDSVLTLINLNAQSIEAYNNNTLILDINGINTVEINRKSKIVDNTFLLLKEKNIFILKDSNGKLLQTATFSDKDIKNIVKKDVVDYSLEPSSTGHQATIIYPKISNPYLHFSGNTYTLDNVKQCDEFRNGPIREEKILSGDGIDLKLTSLNATACASWYSPNLPHDQGYVIFINAKNVKGRGLHFWVENNDQKYATIETYLPKRKEGEFTFINPPLEPFGDSYSFHIRNISIGNDETINIIKKIDVFPIPYSFLKSINFSSPEINKNYSNNQLVVSHPQESLYSIEIAKGSPRLIILSQSFDEGWKLYKIAKSYSDPTSIKSLLFPFLIGREQKDHVKLMGWANGWILDENPSQDDYFYIAVYMPQYLEYIGFILLILFFVIGIILAKGEKKSSTQKL